MLDAIFKVEEKPEVDKIAEFIKNLCDKQQDTMHLIIQSVNLGIAIGKEQKEQEKQTS